MSVSEFQRHQIFQWFEEAMGSERAAIMMDLLPPVGWGDIATRSDLDIVRMEIRAAEDRLDARMSRLESSLTRSFVTWLLASQAATVTLIGIMIGVLVAFS
jgi:hypothetical protein